MLHLYVQLYCSVGGIQFKHLTDFICERPQATAAMPGDECDYTPRTKARKLRAALETAASEEEGPGEVLRGDAGGPRLGTEELSASIPAGEESTADGDGEDDSLILRLSD